MGVAGREPLLIAIGEAGLALIVLLYFYGRIAANRLNVLRVLPPRASQGETIVVTPYLVNRSRLPLFRVRMVDRFRASFEVERRLCIESVPAGGGPVAASYAAMCDRERGVYTAGPVTLHVPDPLGLFTHTRGLEVFSEILVLPRMFGVAALPMEGLRNAMDAGVEVPVRAGSGSTFMGTREYVPGDDVRRVHWRSSARWDRLVLKEFESVASREITIFLDLSRASVRGILGFANLEASIRIAASVCQYAADRRIPFQVLGRSDREILIPPGTGSPHLERVLEVLAVVRPDGETPYPEMVLDRLSAVREGSTVLLLIQNVMIDAEGLAVVLHELRRRGALVLGVILEEAGFVRVRGPSAKEAAGRRARLFSIFEAAGFRAFPYGGDESERALFGTAEAGI